MSKKRERFKELLTERRMDEFGILALYDQAGKETKKAKKRWCNRVSSIGLLCPRRTEHPSGLCRKHRGGGV